MSTKEPPILKTPPEWAEHLGITKLRKEEWQEVPYRVTAPDGGVYRVGAENRSYTDGNPYKDYDSPLWETPMTNRDFIDSMEGKWYEVDADGKRAYFGQKRTFKRPQVTFTQEQILDVLGIQDNWISTGRLVWEIVEPMGLFVNDNLTYPTNKIRDLLKLMQHSGTVITSTDYTKSGGDTARLGSGRHRLDNQSNHWALPSRIEEWEADRTLDDDEEKRRLNKLADFKKMIQGEGSYSHPGDNIFIDGEYQPEIDERATVKLPWETMERIIDEIARKES